MAEITITHTRAEGTLLDGSVKGDGVFDIVRNYGFWFSRSRAIDGLFIRQSRDKEAQMWRINGAADALREAGHTVTTEIDEDTRRPFEVAEADRQERAEDRAARYSERADRAAATSDARYQASHAIAKYMTGEPIKVGHHSERAHRRAIERMDDHMHASIEEEKKAGYWSNRARAAENYKAFRENPQRTLRRLERLGADLRTQERHLAEANEKGWDGGRHERAILDLTEEIAAWEKIVEKAKADGVKLWTPDDFAPGDFVLYSRSWYQVQRVNPKTLSIAWNLRLAPKLVMTLEDATSRGRVWTHPADYTNVEGRCPEAAMLASLADGKVPGIKKARAASEEQPASAVREAQAAKPKPKKKSDPKVPRKVFVVCPIGGEEATLTWLNGGSRPHKDFEPVKVTPPDGEKFRRAIWSRTLQAEVVRILAEQGYECGGDDWAVSPDRSGFVRPIQPRVRQEAAPEVGPSAEAVAVVVEQPAPESPAADVEPPAEAAPAADAEQPVDEPEVLAPEVTDASKTALTCDFSGITRNQTDRPSVVHSDYPLTPTVKEAAMNADHLPKRRARKIAQYAEMREQIARRPEIERTPELDAAYRRYVDDGIAATDGHYAPIDFQSWAYTLGKAEVVAAISAAAEAPPVTAIAKVPAEKKTARKPKAKALKAVETTAAVAATETAPEYATKSVQKMVPLDKIDRDESQPREEFDQAKLEELAGSIRKLGVLQPISLRYSPSTRRYTIVMGERRVRASKMAGKTEILAVVSHGVQEGARETLARQVAENVGRADMTPIEEAKSFARLIKAEYTVDEVAEMCGKSAAYIGWRIDLLRLCDSAQEALGKSILPVGMAWYVSQLTCENQMRFLSKYTRGAFNSDRDAEAFVKAARIEEERRESQGSFFVLADESAEAKGDVQGALPGVHDVPEEERERIVTDRTKLTKKIDRLAGAGEILAELATADPEELALLLAGTPGGLGGHILRAEHLRALTTKVIGNLRKAQAIAEVRAGAIVINPEAEAAA